ncbi:tetratricopeptide repeat protein [Streptomyces sp. M2CJ-2]|uniref:tetratricopeptide repeat protein n=1 Tax=Streptomyces sp. M2CJ-2 TaxID=2803948 RepID=UPI001922E0EF|nr:tetratricopeptide repeat protein [Streptomyces sp. M2CJ-2]MBL3666612.1 tetratricopeptide repeat protein [Streptomyces sp. M2CJ-2]
MIGAMPREADCFQHRDQIDDIKRSLDESQVAAQFQLLVGPGGVGKTQIAAHSVREILAQKSFDVVVWASANSRESVQSAYTQAISTLTGADLEDSEQAAKRFLAWAQTTSKSWVVVLDDVDSPATLRGLWPDPRANGRVIVTTRRRDAALGGIGRKLISVGLFDSTEAERYLREKLAAQGRVDNPNDISALAAALGYLPLALAQAAAYIVDFNLSCATYRRLFSERRKALSELLPDADSLPDDHQATVTATWSLSIEQADLLPPSRMARPMLFMAALLDPNGIPESVLTSPSAIEYLEDFSLGGDAVNSSERAADAVDRATATLRNLHRLSLVEAGSGSPSATVHIHALVQRAIVESCKDDEFRDAAIAVADGLLEVWPEDSVHSKLDQVLRANTEVLYQTAGSALHEDFCHDVLIRLGQSYIEAGFSTAAVAYYGDLRSKVESTIPGHWDTFFVRLGLADALEQGGNYTEAIAEYKSIIRDVANNRGQDDSLVFLVRSSLAEAVGASGDTKGSVQVFEELLRDRIRVQGSNHEETRDTRRRLVAARSADEDYPGAIATCEELLADEVAIYGPDHHHSRHTRIHLAEAVGDSGDVHGAVRILEEIASDAVRLYGPSDPETFTCRDHLGNWYLKDGRPSKAVSVFRELLNDETKAMGEWHPDVIDTQWSLIRALDQCGASGEALVVAEDVFRKLVSIYGPRSARSLNARGLLAHWKGRNGEIFTAREEFSQLVADCEEYLGADHLMTVDMLQHLARWIDASGDLDAALPVYRRVLTDRLRIHGPDDGRVLNARHALAFHLMEMGDSEGAMDFFRVLLEEQSRVLGEDHPDVQHTRQHLEDLESDIAWYGE